MDDVQRPAVNTWKMRAACLDLPVDIFFPMPGPKCRTKINLAKAICDGCPVKAECLDYAMSFVRGSFTSLPGVYGGTTEKERIRLSRTHVINTR